MKFKFDIKNKRADLEADVEKLVEKGMDQHDKNWKDKFSTKYNARKEILEIHHKHKMEIEENKQKKKNWIQKIQEENRMLKELELKEKLREEEEQKKLLKIKIIISIILGIISVVMMCVGFIFGSASGDSNSGWYGVALVGFFPLLSIVFIWTMSSDKKR